MKISYLLLLFILVTSCEHKTNSKATEKEQTPTAVNEVKKEISIIEKLANANGFKNWDDVKELKFTFNVNNNGKEFKRDWHWKVNEEMVYMTLEDKAMGTSLTNNPNKQVHSAFINDSYWLLFPFQLMWTDGYDVKVNEKSLSPFNEKELTELTINFYDEGGYTPGDTYKLYINSDYKIEEWSFYPAGSEEPRIINAWENYKDFNGISISTDRRNQDGSFRIYFTDIDVIK